MLSRDSSKHASNTHKKKDWTLDLECESSGFWVWAHQGLGVTEDVVLEELVEHVEEVVLHQRLDHQLVQVVLQQASTGEALRRGGGTSLLGLTCTGIWNWFRERMYSISTAMMNL